MSSFARIKLVAKYAKVVYYSIVMTDDDDSETLENTRESLFEFFLKNHTTTNRAKLNHILEWIKKIGETRGAIDDDFRHEKTASALPPSSKSGKPYYIDSGKKQPNNLRLYCFPANKHVVFLFNGDLKTKKYAQECDNVRDHFNLANKLTSTLNKLIVEKDISWNTDHTDIAFSDDLIFEI